MRVCRSIGRRAPSRNHGDGRGALLPTEFGVKFGHPCLAPGLDRRGLPADGVALLVPATVLHLVPSPSPCRRSSPAGVVVSPRLGVVLALWSLWVGCGALTPAPRYTHDPRTQLVGELAKRQRADHRRLRAVAKRYVGVPYRFGGNSRKNGMDCSALTRAIMREAYGIELPRTAAEMRALGTPVAEPGALQPGDLVFFRDTYSGPGISHVGVYLGDGRFAHASAALGGTIGSLDTPYFHQRYAGARRVRG